MKKNQGLRCEKLSKDQYLIGTKKVNAKINNGILLIRTGGGFISFEDFYNKYGEQELHKQQREEEKQNVNSMDQFFVAKKMAGKFKKNIKARLST